MTISRTFKLLLTLILAFQLNACGYLLYPERKNQAKGPLDPAIVALDAIGLLFFLLPGVIAFAVDFSTGTIYLPQGHVSNSDETYKTISFDVASSSREDIEQIISRELNTPVHFDDPALERVSLESEDELSFHFNQFKDQKQVASIK